jgi:hypothetical protein
MPMGGVRGELCPANAVKACSAILVAEDEVLIRLEIAEQAARRRLHGDRGG